MYYTQIEKMMKILKESKLPKVPYQILGQKDTYRPDRIALIDKHVDSYKRKAETQKGKKFDSSMEMNKILNEIFAYLGEIIEYSLSQGDKETLKKLDSILPLLYKVGEANSNLPRDNVIMTRMLGLIFEKAKQRKGGNYLDQES